MFKQLWAHLELAHNHLSSKILLNALQFLLLNNIDDFVISRMVKKASFDVSSRIRMLVSNGRSIASF